MSTVVCQAVERMSDDRKFFATDLKKTVDISDPKFDDWDSVLAWQPSKMECPEDIDQNV